MTTRILIASVFLSAVASGQAPAAESLASPCELVAEIDGARCDVLEFRIGDTAAPILRLRFASVKAEREAVMRVGKAVSNWCIEYHEKGLNDLHILRVLEERRRIELATCAEQSLVEPAA